MKAQDLPFTQLLQGAKQFIIPIFQRTYSWEITHCRQLWDDILRVETEVDKDNLLELLQNVLGIEDYLIPAIAERLRMALEQSTIASDDGQTIRVTMSVGLCPVLSDSASTLASADAALYQAKNTGRNRVVRADTPEA